MTAQRKHTYLPMENIELQVPEDGISLENLPSSLLQGKFLEFDSTSSGKGVSF